MPTITLTQNELTNVIDYLTDINYHTESLAFQALQLISNSRLNKNKELLEIVNRLGFNRQQHLKVGYLDSHLLTDRDLLIYSICYIRNIIKESVIETVNQIEITQDWLIEAYKMYQPETNQI